MDSKEIPQLVKDRWKILKQKYPYQDLKAEYQKWIEWRRSKGRKDPPASIRTLEWFESDRLKNKPVPRSTPTLSEYSESKKHYYSGQTAQSLNVLDGVGLLTPEIRTVLHKCVCEEGMNVYNLQEWIAGHSKPVYPNGRMLMEMLKQKYNKTV